MAAAKNLRDRRCVIAGLVSAKDETAESRVLELKRLLGEGGATVLATVVQRRGVSRASKPGGARLVDAPMSPATYIGPGKALELARVVAAHSADTVVFLNRLTSTQLARLEELAGCEVIHLG